MKDGFRAIVGILLFILVGLFIYLFITGIFMILFYLFSLGGINIEFSIWAASGIFLIFMLLIKFFK